MGEDKEREEGRPNCRRRGKEKKGNTIISKMVGHSDDKEKHNLQELLDG